MQRVLLTQRQITIICAIIKRPKKACLKRFALEMASVIVVRRGTAENSRTVGFFPHVFVYFEC